MTSLDNQSVRLWFRRDAKKNKEYVTDVRFPYLMGIELELEDVDDVNPPEHWTTHHDGSLRNGIEFVTRTPISGDTLVSAIRNFYNKKFNYTNGPRTSTHIHVNAYPLSVGNVRALFAVSYAVENALFSILEAKRKWCGYCMALSEMDSTRARELLNTTKTEMFKHNLGTRNEDKYYGLNLSSIAKHGTIEFRYFPGAPTKDELYSWLDYCTQMVKMCQSVTLDQLSTIESAEAFMELLKQHLPRWSQKFLDAGWAEDIYSNLQDCLNYLVPYQGPARLERLVFANNILIDFTAKSRGFTDAQTKYFRDNMKELKVMTLADWNNGIKDAMNFREVPNDPVVAPPLDRYNGELGRVIDEEYDRLVQASALNRARRAAPGNIRFQTYPPFDGDNN